MTVRALRWLLVGIVMALCAAAAQADDSAVAKATDVLAAALTADAEGVRLQAARLAAELSTPGLEAAARALAASPDRFERSLALELLSHIDVGRNRDLFEAALTSPFRSVRVRAVQALATLKDPALAGPLVAMLANDIDPDLRALAAGALGATGGGDVRAALRRALADPHPVVQVAAVEALAASGDDEVGLELLGRAESAAPAEARRLLGLVALVPDRDLMPRLGTLLASPDPSVRSAAAAAILRIDERSR
ncbi:MAG TPA: HEAT repeat domain-containing protein [Thermoanaerobaculales bacterium]|nr:HEAT repeat domain-containing protein [Thermoanaerobaculales bacterium]HQN97425.1 HEAT repeat domain-containing protein [Thermoanaerobaculales bacterium]HQP43357.1 HEAT repeat domain-containing protein [Thermoanaerobaculales bacterium]